MHPESLRRLHLLDHAFRDPSFGIVPRAVDRRWHYAGVVPVAVTGFNPFVSAAFVGVASRFSSWSASSMQSARPWNDGDHLVKEALWVAHDYLHAWAFRALHHLCPELGLGTRAITPENLEDLVFAYLVTEAVAVAGLDYWYLSVRDVESRCPVGTRRAFVAVSYRERDRAEYCRMNPGFTVQDRAFFAWLCEGYLSGRYVGFSVEDLERSPALSRWLTHELRYGIKQRRYIRQWLHHLAGQPDWGALDWDAPVAAHEPWKRDVVAAMADLLWRKVKRRAHLFFPRIAEPGETWQTGKSGSPDLRFVNVACVSVGDLPRGPDDGAFRRWFFPYLSSFDFDSFDRDLLALVPRMLQERSPSRVEAALRGQKRLVASAREPRDLLMLP